LGTPTSRGRRVMRRTGGTDFACILHFALEGMGPEAVAED